MGRRYFFLLGASLLIILGPERVLGQTPSPAPAEVDAASFPATTDDLAEPERLPVVEPGKLPERLARPVGAAPKRDDEVERIQAAPGNAPAPAAAPDPAAAAGAGGVVEGGFMQPLDRLPLGKHEVLLSVNVLAPQDMNINKEATVKIVVKNNGSADALGVVVRDDLPTGLEFVSSLPEAQRAASSLLTWSIGILQAGTEKVILVKVKPTQATPMDHAATVTFQAGSKARSRVLQPKLKVEVVQTPSIDKVLKGKAAEFRISVTNTGDGPARDVVVLAKLSAGLSHESGEKNDDNSFDLPIKEIGPGQREELPVMVVDAKQGGHQTCQVKATSPDVVFNKEEAEIEKALEVIEPKLKITLDAPEKRYTDTIASYTITLENPGSAPAKNVRVLATLPVSGQLVTPPPGAKYDPATRRITWTLSQIDPTEKPRTLTFEVKMGGIGFYQVTAEARADNAILAGDKRSTDVQGMADLDLVVRERRRVVDVDGTTTFQVRLRNYGSKEAANVQVRAEVSPNLRIEETAGGPTEPAKPADNNTKAMFPKIDRIQAGKEMTILIKVKVVNHDEKASAGVCRVFVSHDDLTQELEDMAMVKVAEGRRTANAKEPPAAK
ncbi:DUF11 domain-containing protein [Paludisphaera borealis]|uniref:Large cysteine-rich periplasmic protein OmcB n=1 Tax=Paludisphaera borealis TaxID=1387353 RepID=A0A1U7CJG8_9BACT|nr:DUF11 domain-containing protein [Paludisphaera borealis]APW59081.1 Large cysteine-rich periplasmic protein OmcB [Paludisphaera borealis]